MSMFSHFLNSHNSQQRPPAQAGFSLIELMVSIGIMVIVMAVIMVRQTSFNGAVLLRSEAYKVALNLRDVQLSAVSAVGNSGDFRELYGAHFTASSPANEFYQIFKDADNDGFYDSGEEFGAQGVLDSRFIIREIRVDGVLYNSPQGLSVVFERPNFDAMFYGSGGPVSATSVQIDVARKAATGNGLGDLRTIEITSAGQIAVQ